MNIVAVATRSKELFASLREMLGEEYDLYFADRLAEVFEALAKRPTDVVFVDARLEDCDGREAVREIAAVFPEVNLIYLGPERAGRESTISAEGGAYARVRRPLERETIRFLAEKAVENRKLSRKIEYLHSLSDGDAKENSDRARDWPLPDHRAQPSGFLAKGMVRKVLKSLSAIGDVNTLLAMFTDSVRELFGSNNVAVFGWDSDKGRYVTGAWQGVDEGLATICSFSTRHGMVRWLIENQQLLTRGKLKNAFSHDVAVEVATDMDALKAEVILPLLEKGNLVGFLSLGRKMTGKKYEEEDLELLAVIGECASGAISTALRHKGLSAEKARTDAILRDIACGIVAVDIEGKIVSMNSFAGNALDLSPRDLVGKSVQKLGSVLADMALRTIKEDGALVTQPYRDRGTGRIFAVSACKMFREGSSISGAILFFTPLAECASPAAKEDGLLGGERFVAFCGNIADRVKNPLSSIKTFAQLLPEKFDDLEFRQKFSDIVGKAVERINLLADGLTAYAAAGQLDLSATNIATVIENAIASLQESLSKRNLRVTAPGSDKPAMILADGQLIRSAFMNVLKNSIESTSASDTISISIREVSAGELRRGAQRGLVFDSTGIDGGDGFVSDEEMFVEAEFRDSGAGIPQAQMTRIGEPFFTTKEQKVGLGLAIARRIVSRHRGRMEIESEEGKGTAVRIVLPREPNSR